jgi:hypothetical protein
VGKRRFVKKRTIRAATLSQKLYKRGKTFKNASSTRKDRKPRKP